MFVNSFLGDTAVDGEWFLWISLPSVSDGRRIYCGMRKTVELDCEMFEYQMLVSYKATSQ